MKWAAILAGWTLFGLALVIGLFISQDSEKLQNFVSYQGWSMIAAIGAWLLAGGIFVAIWQITQAKRSTNAQIAIQLFDKLRDKDTKDDLRYTYRHLSREKIWGLSDQSKQDESDKRNRDMIDGLFDKFELLGSLVKQGIVDETLAIEAFAGPSALRLWHQSVLYVKEERKKRGFFLKNYEFFAEHAFMHFKDNKIPILFTTHMEGPVDLIQKFQEKDYKYPPGTLGEVIKKESEERLGKGEV